MEIDVTHMVEDADEMIELSGSQAEHGVNAGPYTWNNSVEYGREHPLLTTDDMRDEARSHFKGYGAWTEQEIAAWSEDELQGMMCQDVANAIREMEHNNLEGEEAYKHYLRRCEEGSCSGRLYRGDDDRWYFSMGD